MPTSVLLDHPKCDKSSFNVRQYFAVLQTFDESSDGWKIAPGEYEVFVGPPSHNTPLTGHLQVRYNRSSPQALASRNEVKRLGIRNNNPGQYRKLPRTSFGRAESRRNFG